MLTVSRLLDRHRYSPISVLTLLLQTGTSPTLLIIQHPTPSRPNTFTESANHKFDLLSSISSPFASDNEHQEPHLIINMPKAARNAKFVRCDSAISIDKLSGRLSQERLANEKEFMEISETPGLPEIQIEPQKSARGRRCKIQELSPQFENASEDEHESTSEDEPRGRPLTPKVLTDRSHPAKGKSSLSKPKTSDDASDMQELIHNVIMRAVKLGNIPIHALEETKLTTASITEFFKKYNEVLMRQWKQDREEQQTTEDDSSNAQNLQDIENQHFNVLQIAFSWARSQLREESRVAEVKKKREMAKAQFSRAREIYLMEKAAGMTNPKDIMISVCSTLEAENPAPKPEHIAEPIKLPLEGTTIGRSQDDAVKYRSRSRFSTPPPPYQKREKSLKLPHRLSLRRERYKRKPQSVTPNNGTSISDEMAKISILDLASDDSIRHRSLSPEKKQKGTRGVARPIFRGTREKTA